MIKYIGRVHFIALGGGTMHNIAIALKKMNWEVSGSDDVFSEPSKTRLENQGLLPKYLGWNPDVIHADLDMVILGMHAKKDNPELKKAQNLGLNIYSFPEFMYNASKEKTRVVIAGSHGKTTITAMILHVLKQDGIETDYLVGSTIKGFDTMVKISKSSSFMLLEGDEYLSSPLDRKPKFLHYKPQIAVISGIAWDHVNVFSTEEEYIHQFDAFIKSISSGGVLIYNEDDSILKQLVEDDDTPIKKIPYSTHQHQIKDENTTIMTEEGAYPLKIFGKHNLSNLSAALWICRLMGCHDDDFYQNISSFEGADRRLQEMTNTPNFNFYLDFAHAPSKVKATVEAVRSKYLDREIIAILELHTFSSLDPDFIKKYSHTLDKADKVVVFYDQEKINDKKRILFSKLDIQSAFKHPNLEILTNINDLGKYLYQINPKNLTLVMMSSGNFGGIDLDSISDFYTKKV